MMLAEEPVTEEVLQAWVLEQRRPPTVAQAAQAFGATAAWIRVLVEEAYWMFLQGEGDAATIELDGE